MEEYKVIIPRDLCYKLDFENKTYYPASLDIVEFGEKTNYFKNEGNTQIHYFMEDSDGEIKDLVRSVKAEHFRDLVNSDYTPESPKVFIREDLARKISYGGELKEEDKNLIKSVSDVPGHEKYFKIFEGVLNKNRSIRNSRNELFYELDLSESFSRSKRTSIFG